MLDELSAYYAYWCTPDPDDTYAQDIAREVAEEHQSLEVRERVFIPSAWRIEAVPCRSYVLAAPRPWWQWVSAWRP